jgi:prevent-host-death family protein
MEEIGIRELKTRASEIVRTVRDSGMRYTITYRGHPVGVISPLPSPIVREPTAGDAWDDLARLGEELGRGWRSVGSSTELLAGMRR